MSLIVYPPKPHGRSVAFNPATLPHLGRWAADTSGLWLDTAGTSAATAAGASLARIDDISGNGHHLVQATSGLRPSLSLTAGPTGNRKGFVCGGTYCTTLDAISSVDTTIILVADHQAGAAWGRHSDYTDYLRRGSSLELLAGYAASRGGSQMVITDSTLWAASGTYAVYSAVITPSAATKGALFRNTTAYATSTTAVGTTALNATLTLGALHSGGPSPGTLFCLELAIGTYSATQRADYVAWLMSRYGIT